MLIIIYYLIFAGCLKGYIKKFGFVQGIFYQLMLSISSNISRDLGMLPGGEFRRAVQEVLITNNLTYFLVLWLSFFHICM